MAIWSNCNGTFTIPKDSGFSLRKHVESLYDEVSWNSLEQSSCGKDLIQVWFDFSFSLDGMSAAKLIDQLVKTVCALPGYKHSQIQSEIRFT